VQASTAANTVETERERNLMCNISALPGETSMGRRNTGRADRPSAPVCRLTNAEGNGMPVESVIRDRPLNQPFRRR